MKTCKDVHRLVIEGQDRKLGFVEKISVRVHLLICVACNRFARQMDLLRQALRQFPGE